MEEKFPENDIISFYANYRPSIQTPISLNQHISGEVFSQKNCPYFFQKKNEIQKNLFPVNRLVTNKKVVSVPNNNYFTEKYKHKPSFFKNNSNKELSLHTTNKFQKLQDFSNELDCTVIENSVETFGLGKKKISKKKKEINSLIFSQSDRQISTFINSRILTITIIFLTISLVVYFITFIF